MVDDPMRQPDQQVPQQVPQQPLQQAGQQAPQQMPYQTSQQPGKPPALPRQHVHHSYIWLSTVQVAITLFVVLFFTTIPFILGEGSRAFGFGALGAIAGGLGILLLFVAILGVVVLIQYLSYRHLFYEVGEEEFNVYSGVFNKKRVHVPYQRIQSVNQKATIMQRIFGVCTINIDTAGGAANKAVVVPYLQNTEAEKLRYELFARKQYLLTGSSEGTHNSAPGGYQVQGDFAHPNNVLDMPAEVLTDVRGVFGAQAVDTGEITYQIGMTNKELFLTGISNSTGFALMIVAAVGTVAGLAGQLLETAVGRWAVSSGAAIAGQIESSIGIWAITAIVVVTLLVVWLVSAIGTSISYGGFRATRRGNRIEVEHGLLQHRFHGVDIDRVQSVIIKQGFIRRLMGYCELSLGKIDAMTEEASSQQQSVKLGLVVHPFVKLVRVPEILAGLAPEFADVPTDTKSVAKVALRRAIIRRCIVQGNGFWLALVGIVAHLVALAVLPFTNADVELISFYITVGACIYYAICLVIIVLDAIGSVLWYRGSSYAYNKTFMQVTNGGFSRESITFPRKKIQYGYTRTNPFQRRAHVKTISAQTAAGIGGTTVRLVDVREDEAVEWLEWVKPRRNVVK